MKNLTLFLILLTLTLTNCETNSSKNKIEILEYSIHNEDVTQAPAKTQVALNVIINTNSTTKQEVKDLLIFLYEKTKKRTGFKYHKNPTNIFIYAFTSIDKAESRMEQWIGMISKNQGETNPKIKISEVQFNSLNVIDEEKWELSKKQRLEVWNKLIHLEDKAQNETNAKYPLDKVGITEKDIHKNANFYKIITKKYKAELAKESGIDYNLIDSIGVEGIKNGWAFPK